jgi:hypothetical protein
MLAPTEGVAQRQVQRPGNAQPAADAKTLPGKVGLSSAACAYSLIKMLRTEVRGDLSGRRGIL